ncbi:MAG: sulfur carrier protein ThiS [Clostridiales bacterium]|uniref:sulfur carrier protein ThiS n=1 Tax=Evtepia sp. TaxID=2773933 RepID=UPI002986015C|nr:sulfur carrier protein ThiS [Evtepia sp.]MDD7289095.1 sulfur carrier protein ThiS [Clostridiales bacterium]MDY3993000.1 sulfur carrier protein ThiS [Evtepia sp.]MDY4430808.1 sulfur carrier protein ThiS [Evtepia sp.]
MVTINGESVQASGQVLLDYLKTAGYDPARVAVERNWEIIPKTDYDKTVLQPGDSLEIVHFVGGG